MSCLVLIGPRGAGKSAAGRRVALRLGWDFVDTDALIEARGRTIAELFAAEGEAGFRVVEARTISALRPTRDTVVATGGGVVLDAANRAHLATLGPVIYLHAAPTLLVARIAGSDRPALTDADPLTEMRQVLAAREPLYRELAGHVVDTGALDVEAVATHLAALARSTVSEKV